MLKRISSQTVILSLGILIIVFAFFFYVKAWQEPTVAPPGGNVPPPINTGPADQIKSGSLTVSGVLSSPMFYDSGNLNYFVNPSGFSNIGGKVSISPTIPDAPKYIALSIDNGNLQMVDATEPSTWASSGDINAKRLCINGVCQGSWPTGGITGSGTTTQIAFFTGGTAIGSDLGLYWDNINKRLSVGTGTTSPSFKIDVYGGDINTSGVYRQSGTAGLSSVTCTASQVLKGTNIRGGIVTGGSCAADETGAGGGAPTDASYVVLDLNGTLTAERVLTAGTGISITDGGVNGNVTITNTGDLSNTDEIQNVISNKGLQRDASNNFGIINCTTNNQIMKYNTITGQWACANDEAGGISWPLLAPDGTAGAPSYSFSADTNTGLFRSAVDTLAITTGGISRLTISTTAANSSLPLTVTTLTTSDGTLWLNDLSTEEGDISRADQIYGLNDLRLGGDSDFTGEPDAYSDLCIYPGGDVSVLNGNLGVGTASPSSKLKIKLKSGPGPDFITEDGLVIQDGSYNNGDVLKVLNAGGTTTWLVVDENGNVGIGTNTPAHLLHVAKSDSTNPVTLKIQNTQGTVLADVQLILGTGQAPTTDTMGAILYADRVTDGGSTDLIFKTSAGITMYNRMIIKADGRIGVGTTTPTYLFDVAGGDINTSGVYRQGGTNAGLSSTTCDPNQVLKGANIRGGIVTGGSCAADDTGVAAEENLRIIRGRVPATFTNPFTGPGFSVVRATSDVGGGFTQTTYTITFTTPFTGLPTVVASIDNPGSSGNTIYVNVTANDKVEINPRTRYPCEDEYSPDPCPAGHNADTAGSGYSGADLRFSFIAVGPR